MAPADATAQLPVDSTVVGKLAPQPALDPTVNEPLVQRRCDFHLDLPVGPAWFASSDELEGDGRIALARNVLGPTANCQRIELVSITVYGSPERDVNREKAISQKRAERIRQFFVTRGISAERIEAEAASAAERDGCTARDGSCMQSHIEFQVRGVAR